MAAPLRIILEGVEREIFEAVDDTGAPIVHRNQRLYATADNVQVWLNAPAAPVPHTIEPEELWPRAKVLFLIQEYKHFKSDPSKRLKTKRQPWENLADLVNSKFGCHLTHSQIENKWRNLERKYKTVRQHNSQSGADRRTCEFEEELAEIFEKAHSINPPYLLGPGLVRSVQDSQAEPAASTQPVPSRVTATASPIPDSSQPSTSRGSTTAGDSQPPSPSAEPSPLQQQPGPARKRPRTDTSRAVLESAVAHLEVAEANRQQRHRERMALEGRKVAAVERRTAALERVAAALERRELVSVCSPIHAPAHSPTHSPIHSPIRSPVRSPSPPYYNA
ncbi:uncharacterized protein LOC144115839 isoform X1 [Amblyomma americanum]